MAIKQIKVVNFKSFKKLDIEIGKFNVLIGANASGKSNFVQIFEFLKNIVNSGLNNATQMLGREYLQNINIGSSENFSVKVVSDQEFGWVVKKIEKDLIGIKIYEVIYEFAIKFKKTGLQFEIVKDKLTQKCHFVKLVKQKEEIKEKLGDGEITFSCVNGKVEINITKPEEVLIEENDIIPPFLEENKLSPNTLLLESPFFFIPALAEDFSEISIYNFNPKESKKATPMTGKAELEEDGSNLAIILKNIIEDKEKKRKLFNLINDLLPFVSNIDVEKFADKFLLFKLREKYFKEQYLPAFLLSDGTINITALIIALYFEKKSLTIIEEPERNIHPYLISKIVNVMKEASQKKHIIVTTHNPEIVKHTDLENLLLVSRNKEGFSIISKPADKEEVKTFLKNEIGIEEIYVQNLLEV